jgi:hypothetical protein
MQEKKGKGKGCGSKFVCMTGIPARQATDLPNGNLISFP